MYTSVRVHLVSCLMPRMLQVLEIFIPARLRSAASGRGSNGVLIEATQPLALHAIDIASQSCGGFLVLPIDALDRFYHVVSWLEPTTQAEMGVLAVYDNTTVMVTLPRSNGVEVCQVIIHVPILAFCVRILSCNRVLLQ